MLTRVALMAVFVAGLLYWTGGALVIGYRAALQPERFWHDQIRAIDDYRRTHTDRQVRKRWPGWLERLLRSPNGFWVVRVFGLAMGLGGLGFAAFFMALGVQTVLRWIGHG